MTKTLGVLLGAVLLVMIGTQADAAPTCDDFTNALSVKGFNVSLPAQAIDNATMELGEPAHMGNIPQKSIWWQWQSPQWCHYYLFPSASVATNYVIAVYVGNSVEALTLLAKSTNAGPNFPATGGQTYYIVAAASTNAVGDISIYFGHAGLDNSAHVIPGNLLKEPSWEGTGVIDAQYWKWSGGLNGYVNEINGGADGTTWPDLLPGTKIWQDFSTTPGHNYTFKFAYFINFSSGSASGDAQVAVSWDTNQLGISDIPESGTGFWHWNSYTTVASNTTSRITFQNLAREVQMDAFSVVDSSAPPSIVNEPTTISGLAGGTATFIVGAAGTPPLSYHWLFNGSYLDGQTNKLLVLSSLNAEQSGSYRVVITNVFGAVTSTVASLVVDEPLNATILSQPYGDTIPVGGYFNFSVVAAGDPPLTYQWFQDNQVVNGATNNNLMLTNVQPASAGTYTVQVKNNSSSAWSLPATLAVSAASQGGGTIDFKNQRFLAGFLTNNAPVFDLDGTTLLNGSRYVAQLYAGPSLDALRPSGQPSPFQDGVNAGYFLPRIITLANVMPGSNVVLQVCVWDADFGTSYEQARAVGGRVGKSGIFDVSAGGGVLPPKTLQGLQSFGLQSGLPYFEVGTISFVERQPPDIIVWALNGQPGSIYLIEKSQRANVVAWQPFIVLTNITGTVTFTDTANTGADTVLYRARILD